MIFIMIKNNSLLFIILQGYFNANSSKFDKNKQRIYDNCTSQRNFSTIIICKNVNIDQSS